MNMKSMIPLMFAVLVLGATTVLMSDSDGSEGATGDYKDGSWYFNVVEGNAVIVGYSPNFATETTVEIPATVSDGANTYSVVTVGANNTAISENVKFVNNTHLIIPDSVVIVDVSAFASITKIVSVTIPDSVTTIGAGAFRGCTGLTSVTIPDSVTTIGNSAFYGCTGLTSVNLPNDLTIISDELFRGCTGLTSVNIPDSVTNIKTNAFNNCTGLTSVTIPDSVTLIGAGTFYQCIGFANVDIPASVTGIGGNAFSRCSNVTELIVRGTPTNIGTSAFDMTALETVYNLGTNDTIVAGAYGIPSTATVQTYWFEYTLSGSNATITKVIGNVTSSLDIPATIDGYNVTVVGNGSNAIIQNSQLSSGATLTIPNGVVSIGNRAFKNCTGLTGALTIPDSVTSIGRYTFQNCSGLTSLDLGDGVTSIGDYSFENCSSLTSVELGEGMNSIGNNAFNDCTGVTTLIIESSPTTIGSNAFNMAGVTEVLNLGDTELNPGSYGLPSTCTVKTEIDADSYIAPASIKESHDKEGAVYTILALLPLFIILGALVVCATTIVRKND